MAVSFLLYLLMLPASANLGISIAEAAPLDYSIPALQAFASTTATQDGLNVNRFLATINCESGWEWDATSTTGDYGIAQWNLRSHPDFTKTQALDPYWSIREMGLYWQDGLQKSWVCYHLIVGST